MRKQLRTLVTFLVLGTLTANAQSAFANGESGVTVSNNNSTEFTNFVNTKTKKIARKNTKDIEVYNEVVKMYFNAPIAFYNLDENTKAVFTNASMNLTEKLSNSRKKEAQKWAKNVSLNNNIFEFIWSNKNAISSEVIPTSVPKLDLAVTNL